MFEDVPMEILELEDLMDVLTDWWEEIVDYPQTSRSQKIRQTEHL